MKCELSVNIGKEAKSQESNHGNAKKSFVMGKRCFSNAVEGGSKWIGHSSYLSIIPVEIHFASLKLLG